MRDKFGKIQKGSPAPPSAYRKGHTPWNKGKHPECVQGKNHPMYGKHHSEETKKKIGRKGSKNARWKGGKVRNQGYIRILKPNHPFCDTGGYIFEHRLVMEKIFGRYLKPFEKVHHKNRIRDDNKPDNLHLYVLGKNWHPKICPKCGFHFLIK